MALTKRQQQALDTKKKIVRTATELINQKGFDNVTVDEIVQQCGIAKGSFYHYFSKKDDLFTCLGNEHLTEIGNELDAMENQNPIDKLRYFIIQWFSIVDSLQISYAQAWYRYALSDGNSEQSAKIEKDTALITSLLTQAIKNGTLSRITPIHTISNDIIFSMYGAGLYRSITNGNFSFLTWSENYADYVINNHLKQYMIK